VSSLPNHKAVQSAAACASRRWYVAQTQPRREELALVHLRRQGFACLCPMRRKPRKIGKRVISGFSPLFPGYVFVSLDLEREQWRSINGTIGVLRLVSFGSGGRPALLPEGFVERLASLSDSDGASRFCEELQAGTRVRVVGGPFDDLCGILEQAGDSERVTILLDLLSKATRVHMRRDLLIAA
jgi:transcription elongation factor/antiterminator RfaH